MHYYLLVKFLGIFFSHKFCYFDFRCSRLFSTLLEDLGMACSKDLYQSFEDKPPDDKDVFLKDKSFFGNEPGNHYRNAINDFVFTHLNILKDHPLVVESAKT